MRERPPIDLPEEPYGRELFAKCRQAAQIGECWAERICRGDLRGIRPTVAI